MSLIKYYNTIFNNIRITRDPINIEYVIIRHEDKISFLFYMKWVVIWTEIMELALAFYSLGCYYLVFVTLVEEFLVLALGFVKGTSVGFLFFLGLGIIIVFGFHTTMLILLNL